MFGHRRLVRIPIVLAVSAAAVTAACSGSGTSSSNGASGADASSAASGQSSAAGSGPTLAALAKAELALPQLPSVAAPSGKSVWIVTCSLEASGCAGQAGFIQSVMEKQLKWKATTFDGKLAPATYQAGITQALVAHTDAIVLVGIDCASVKPALQKAKAAKVPVVGAAGYDCTDPSQGGGQSLLTATDVGGSAAASFAAQGRALADYMTAETNGSGKAVVATEPDFQVVVAELAGFKTELAKVCPGCSVAAEAPALGADLANGSAAAKLSSTLLQQPSATVVVALQDSQLSYVTNALRTSAKKVPVIASGGTAADVQLIKNGTIKGIMAQDLNLQAWVTSDFVVRLLATTAPVTVQPALTLVDKDHNLPSSGGFVTPVDYQSAYKKAWGVS